MWVEAAEYLRLQKDTYICIFLHHNIVVTRPGIEPGSKQPQCFILTTIRSSPFATNLITYIIDFYFTLQELFFYVKYLHKYSTMFNPYILSN